MNVTLKDRTAETAAVYFERTRSPIIRKFLPQKAQTLEEALADFRSPAQEALAGPSAPTDSMSGTYGATA